MDELRKLEKTGEYLFHGSTDRHIKQFEPRQAYSRGEKDGALCVAASEFIEPAIFMAVLGSKKLGGWKTNKNGRIVFYLLRSEFNKAEEQTWAGYVYAFKRDATKFNPYRGWEWRAYCDVVPIKMFSVGMDHLPANIKLLDSYDQYVRMSETDN